MYRLAALRLATRAIMRPSARYFCFRNQTSTKKACLIFPPVNVQMMLVSAALAIAVSIIAHGRPAMLYPFRDDLVDPGVQTVNFFAR